MIVNSGNANCATGRAGIQVCRRVCRDAAEILGVISLSLSFVDGNHRCSDAGQQDLREVAGVDGCSIGKRERGVRAFAQAIMTTDTRPKIASARVPYGLEGRDGLGIAKGAGMIHPNLATMLVYIRQRCGGCAIRFAANSLRDACDESLNCISIDGDTSTNDTVLLLASGASGAGMTMSGSKRNFLRL